MKRIVKKEDLKKIIPGIEKYHPGDIRSRNQYLSVSSGTSGSFPTTVFVENMREAGDEASPWIEDVRAEVRLSSNNYMTLRRCTELLFDSQLERILCLETRDLSREDLHKLFKDFSPIELKGVPSLLEMLIAKVLSSSEGTLSKIKRIYTIGELLHDRIYSLFRKVIPLSDIYIEYGLSEMPVYLALNKVEKESDRNDYFIRSTSPCTVTIESPDKEGFGEIIVSGPPIGAYHSGDEGKLEHVKGKTKLTLRGRDNFDVVHCLGATFLASEIEHVVEGLREYINDYLVEIKEREKIPVGTVTLYVLPTAKLLELQHSQEFIANSFSEKLFVTKTQTLASLIKKGIFEPIIVDFDIPKNQNKKKYRLRKRS